MLETSCGETTVQESASQGMSVKMKRNRNPHPLTKDQIADRLFMFFGSQDSCLKNWSRVIFSSDFENEPELVNRAMVIWISATFDVIDSERRLIKLISNQTNAQENEAFQKYIMEARRFIAAAKAMVQIFDKEEQIMMQSFRDVFVHGWLHKIHEEKIPVKYVENDKLETVYISKGEFFKYERQYFLGVNAITPDAALESMRTRLYEHAKLTTNYPLMVNRLAQPGVMAQIALELGVGYR